MSVGRTGMTRMGGRWCLVLSLGTAAACNEPEEQPMFVAGGTGDETIMTPAFLEPASGVLPVPSTRAQDIRLQVADIDVGATALLVDGQAFGQLGRGHPFGELGEDELVIHLRGALRPGPHRLELVTQTEASVLRSGEITIEINPADAPLLVASEGTAQLDARVVAGFGGPVLAALDDRDPADPRLTVVRLQPEGWDWADARTVSIEDYVGDARDNVLALSADVTHAFDGSPDRLRVAWRQGNPGRTIALIDAAYDGADLDSFSSTAMTLSTELTGAVEYAEFYAPLLAGDVVLAPMLAATDTEVPRPGDLAVARARLSGVPATAQNPQRLSFGAAQDIDQLGIAIDLAHAEFIGSATVSARIQGRRSVVLEIGSDDGIATVRPSRTDDTIRTFANTTSALTSVAGAFGSRTVIAVAPGAGGRVGLLRADDLSGAEPEAFSLSEAELPPLEGLSGPVTITTLGGAAVALLPFGSAAPVQAIVLTGDAPEVTPLEGLQCTSIAAPAASLGGPDEAVPLACARDGQVFDATLTQIDPP